MSLEYRVIEIEKRDPRYIAALDHALFEECDAGRSPPTLIYHNWGQAVSLSATQQLSDLNLDECDRRGFTVVRMRSGGKAVVHFPDREFSYSLFTPLDGKLDVTKMYEFYCGKIRDALASFGLPSVEVRGNDIFVTESKIAGNAQRHGKKVSMQQGLILYDAPDAQTMLALMNPTLYPSHSLQELQEILTGFSVYSTATQKQLLETMTHYITNSSFYFGELTERERKRADELVKEYSQLGQGSSKLPLGLCWYPAPAYLKHKKQMVNIHA